MNQLILNLRPVQYDKETKRCQLHFSGRLENVIWQDYIILQSSYRTISSEQNQVQN